MVSIFVPTTTNICWPHLVPSVELLEVVLLVPGAQQGQQVPVDTKLLPQGLHLLGDISVIGLCYRLGVYFIKTFTSFKYTIKFEHIKLTIPHEYLLHILKNNVMFFLIFATH